jgi:hypothetical protein
VRDNQLKMEMTMIEKLPDGVHRLSDESVAMIQRIAARSAEQTARFAKRAS